MDSSRASGLAFYAQHVTRNYYPATFLLFKRIGKVQF